jgi:hypothetical protein
MSAKTREDPSVANKREVSNPIPLQELYMWSEKNGRIGKGKDTYDPAPVMMDTYQGR